MSIRPYLLGSLAATFFLLHFENAKVVLFGVPIYMVEMGVIASAAVLFWTRKQKGEISQRIENIEGWRKGAQRKEETGGIKGKQWGKMMLTSMRFVRANNYSPVHIGMVVLLLGVLSSTLVAAFSRHALCPMSQEGLLRALGILKSWFAFPILFGWILFRASGRYFSREKLLFIFTVSFLPISILSLLGWIFGSGMTYDHRLSGIFNSPNALAMHLTPAIILLWYFFRSRISRSQFFIFHFSFFILLSFLLFLTHSISAWIAVAIGIFLFEYMTRTRWVREGVRANNYSPLRYTAVFLVFSGIIILSQWNTPRFEHFFDPDSRSSFASRLMIWRSAKAMIANSPLFGVGPGNFQSCYLAYQQYFPPYLEWSVPEPHTIFLAFWLGGGLMGLLAFGFLVVWWFRTVFFEIKKEENHLILSALTAIMLTVLIHGLVDTTYWRLGLAYSFWIVFFMGVSPSPWQRRGGSGSRQRGLKPEPQTGTTPLPSLQRRGGKTQRLILYIFPSWRLRKKSVVSSVSRTRFSAS